MPLLFLSTMVQPSLEMEGFEKQQGEIPYPLPALVKCYERPGDNYYRTVPIAICVCTRWQGVKPELFWAIDFTLFSCVSYFADLHSVALLLNPHCSNKNFLILCLKYEIYLSKSGYTAGIIIAVQQKQFASSSGWCLEEFVRCFMLALEVCWLPSFPLVLGIREVPKHFTGTSSGFPFFFPSFLFWWC